MSDLNLFDSEGFQDSVVSEEAPPPLKQQEKESAIGIPETRQMKKANKKPRKRKRKKKYSGHEIFSFLFSAAIIALVIWFFVLRKEVIFNVSEYPSNLFELQRHANKD